MSSKKKKRFQPKPGTAAYILWKASMAHKVLQTAKDCAVVEPNDYIADLILTHENCQKLMAGTASPGEFDMVALRFNMAMHRAREIQQGLPELMLKANHAVQSCRHRYLTLGKFGFSGPELENFKLGMEIFEEVVRNSSKLQLNQAWKKGLEGAYEQAEINDAKEKLRIESQKHSEQQECNVGDSPTQS